MVTFHSCVKFPEGMLIWCRVRFHVCSWSVGWVWCSDLGRTRNPEAISKCRRTKTWIVAYISCKLEKTHGQFWNQTALSMLDNMEYGPSARLIWILFTHSVHCRKMGNLCWQSKVRQNSAPHSQNSRIFMNIHDTSRYLPNFKNWSVRLPTAFPKSWKSAPRHDFEVPVEMAGSDAEGFSTSKKTWKVRGLWLLYMGGL